MALHFYNAQKTLSMQCCILARLLNNFQESVVSLLGEVSQPLAHYFGALRGWQIPREPSPVKVMT